MDTLDEPFAHLGPIAADSMPWSGLWEYIDAVPGWLTEAQGAALRSAVRALRPGATVLEIGAHRGRSTLVLATARPDVRVVTIDPFIRTRLLPGPQVQAELRSNLTRFGVADRVRIVPVTSGQARQLLSGPFDLLWIDGRHDIVSLHLDLWWTRCLPIGAPVLIHDAFSSIGVTSGLIIDQLSPSSRLRYLHRVGSLAHFTHETASRHSRLRFAANLCWWLRNVTIKVLLRLRLRRVAQVVFDHHISADPF